MPLVVASTMAQEGIEEIEVKAKSALVADNAVSFKTGTPIIDVPNAVSVTTEEQIRQQGFTQISDIVDYTPGVTNTQGEGHRDAVVFRGVRSTSDFFLDGVRDDVQYYRSLYNLEQVEVLKGANALLYGRGGTGGIINRSSKKAEVGSDFTNYQASADTFGETLLQFDQNYALSEDSAFRLNIHRDDLANHRDFYDGTRVGIDLDYTKNFGEDTTFRASYEFLDHQRFIDRGIPTDRDGRPAEQLDGTTFGDPSFNENLVTGHIFNVTLDHKFSKQWKGSATAAFSDFEKTYANLFPANGNDSTGASTDFAFDPTTGEIIIDGYIDSTDRQTYTLAGNLVGEFYTGDVEHTVIVGTEFVRQESDQFRFNAVFSPNNNGDSDTAVFNAFDFSLNNRIGNNGTTVGFTDLNDDTNVIVDVFSLYVQDEIAISDQLDLVLGARFDTVNIDSEDRENAADSAENSDQQISPRFGLIYKPLEAVSLYASYTESFQPRSGDQFTDLGSASDRFDADTFSNLEIGGKWNVNDNLFLTASVFELNQNSVTAGAVAGTLDVLNSETQGFETQLSGYLTDKWSISAGYSYLNAEDEDGETPREVPENTFSIWNTYQVSSKLGLGLGVTYQDEQFAANGLTENVRVTLPSYTRVDAAVYYDISENYRVQLNVENLFDTTYFPSSHTANNITVGAPINARLTFSGRF